MDALAGAAEEHARREHGVALDGAETADRLLRKEAGADAERIESLAACYGAWLGRLARQRWSAEWTGLSEPVAPRLKIGGVLVSPIDAVRRRIRDAAAPALPAILERFAAWARRPEPDPAAWDRLAADPRFAGPQPVEDPEAALDPWVREEGVSGKALLCLGAGGGRQGPLHAAAGANVTVVDVSDAMLEHDRRAGLRVRRTSMDDLGAIGPFDLVVQPVSACYVPDLARVYAEVARVLRPGGLYVVQHKQPASLQGGARPPWTLRHPLVDGAALPPEDAPHREPGTREFLHSLDAILGGLCRAGFVIEDVVEPPRGDALAPDDRASYLPPYLKIKARRRVL